MGILGRRKEVKRFTVVAPNLESFFIQIKNVVTQKEQRSSQAWSA